jgi:hypothetical protein
MALLTAHLALFWVFYGDPAYFFGSYQVYVKERTTTVSRFGGGRPGPVVERPNRKQWPAALSRTPAGKKAGHQVKRRPTVTLGEIENDNRAGNNKPKIRIGAQAAR